MMSKLSAWGCALILSVLIVSGCEADVEIDLTPRDEIRGSGNLVIEDRAVGDFKRVALLGAGDVIITQGEEESLTVEADDNLIQYIKTEVKNGTLLFDFTNEGKRKKIRPSEKIRFNLTVKEVAGLDLFGAGNINVSSLAVDQLEIVLNGAGDVNIGSLTADKFTTQLNGAGNVNIGSLIADNLITQLNGAGDVTVTGQVIEQAVYLRGAGDYRAGNLESQSAIVEIPGAGNATVWATEALDVRIPGAGNVEYYGDPRVTKDISRIGRLVQLGDP